MAQINTHPSEATSSRADQPWLLPSNRKLRNVIAISARNLFLTSPPTARTRGKTIDDDALPQTLTSPAKLVALREQKALAHSRSSTDLRTVAEGAIADGSDREHISNGSAMLSEQKKRPQSTSPTTLRRPDSKRMRRRSTIEWANASPQKRQERLEHVTIERMADVFCTLHVPGVKEPVYISEIVASTMNPTFRHIDWTACGPGVTRLQQLAVRIWTRSRSGGWRQMLELQLDLRTLTYLGKSLDLLTKPLPQNSVLLQLSDGIYTSFPDDFHRYESKQSQTVLLKRTLTSSTQRFLPTSTFDALLRLSKLDDSIQDALATQNRIANDLETLLQINKDALDDRDEVAEAEDRLKTIEFAKKTVHKQLEKAHKQQDERRDSIAARRRLMISDGALQESQHNKMQQGLPELPGVREENEVKKKAILSQQRRICEELQRCFPIEPVPGKTLAFSIRGLHLPNAEEIDSEQPETISAALGYIAQVLQLFAFYVKQALPYPVTPRGNTSVIYDPISILKTNNALSSEKAEMTLRTYPLFSKGVPRFRFEYAIFLLNQDIRVLLEDAFDLRVLDIRQTLPNLKYLMVVATAGDGDLPARKAGGIRAFMRGGAPGVRRAGSTDSTSSGMSGLTLAENGRPRSAADRLREINGRGKDNVKH